MSDRIVCYYGDCHETAVFMCDPQELASCKTHIDEVSDIAIADEHFGGYTAIRSMAPFVKGSWTVT